MRIEECLSVNLQFVKWHALVMMAIKNLEVPKEEMVTSCNHNLVFPIREG